MRHVTLHLLWTKNMWPASPCSLVSLVLWKKDLLLSHRLCQPKTKGHVGNQKLYHYLFLHTIFVAQPQEHHSALHHNKSVHQHIILCTSTAKQTIAVKRSASANTNTSSLAAKKHPLSRFGFSYTPEIVHDQIILSCFNCVSIFIGKKIDRKSLASLKKKKPTWKVIAGTLLQRDKMFDLTGTFICECICRAKITLKQDFRAAAVLGLSSF